MEDGLRINIVSKEILEHAAAFQLVTVCQTNGNDIVAIFYVIIYFFQAQLKL